MYLSQQIIFHLFNHFKTLFSWRIFMSTFFSPVAVNNGVLWIRELGKEDRKSSGEKVGKDARLPGS